MTMSNWPRVGQRRGGPRTFPAWRVARPVLAWSELTGTALRNAAPDARAFCGMALSTVGGRAICALIAPGGHGDAWDNRGVALDLMDDILVWTRRHEPTPFGQTAVNVRYYADNRPTARHLYWNQFSVPQLGGNRIVSVGASAVYGNSYQDAVDVFDLATNQWDGIVPDQPGASGSGYADAIEPMPRGWINEATGEIFSFGGSGARTMYKWSPVTKSMSVVTTNGDGTGINGVGCYDPVRGQHVVLGRTTAEGDAVLATCHLVAGNGLSRQVLTFTGPAATAFANDQGSATGNLMYDAKEDRFLYFNAYSGSGTVFVITPNAGTTWTVTLLGNTGAPPADEQTYSRVRMVEALDGLVFFNADAGGFHNGYFLRLR